MLKNNTQKRLASGIITIVVLAICLCITTFALISSIVSVDKNLFHTGSIKINLNDGKPVISEDEFTFEPGMTVKKDFFIENEGSWQAYYKIYLDDVTGGLAKVLQITIKEDSKILYSGTAAQLTKQQVKAADDLLEAGEHKDLSVYFHYPQNAGNASQGNSMTFTICADATQTKNNPNTVFDQVKKGWINLKALGIIRNVIVWIIAACAICMMIFTIISVTTFDRTDRDLFGYKAFISLSDSMSATDFNAGDLVITKEVDPYTLEAGDIIAFTSQDTSNYGEVVTHKIRRITTDNAGELGFVTYGTTTDTDDETVVTYSYVLGKYTSHIPKVGTFFQFLKTVPGYIVCILVPFVLLILLEGVRCIRLFRKYKAEQQEELQSERDKVEAERAETQRMMEELMKLRAQMEQQGEGFDNSQELQGSTQVKGTPIKAMPRHEQNNKPDQDEREAL